MEKLVPILLPKTTDASLQLLGTRQIGVLAFECLQSADHGTVVAVFKRSFYVRFGSFHICVGDSDIGMGPINLRTNAVTGVYGFDTHLRVGESVTVQGRSLTIGGSLHVRLTPTSLWSPCRLNRLPDIAIVSQKFSELNGIAPWLVPADGLAQLIWRRPDFAYESPVLELAQKPFSSLCKWLTMVFDERRTTIDPIPSDAVGLLGHGPGLTPSGDDLIGGVLIVLKTLGYSDATERFSGAIKSEAGIRTSPLSAAHLDAAMHGMGAEVIHEAHAGLLTNEGAILIKRIQALNQMGHTSGWDAFSGVVLGLGLWLKSKTGKCPFPERATNN